MDDKELLQAIKQIIAPLETDMKEIKGRLTNIEGELTHVKDELTNVKGELTHVKREVVKTNLRIENEVIPSIQLLKEGHQLVYEKIKNWKEEYDELASTVLALDIMHTDDDRLPVHSHK